MQHIIIKSITPSPELAAARHRQDVRGLRLVAATVWTGVCVLLVAMLWQMQHIADLASRV